MATRYSMQRRLRMNRPSLRLNARPPKQRTPRGEDFTAANLGVALAMQQCKHCSQVNYPPREVCGQCLHDELVWGAIDTRGELLQAIDLHHSLWEFFKRRIATQGSWPIATVKLAAGPVVFCHLATACFAAFCSESGDAKPGSGSAVNVFSHHDCGQQSVLIAVPAATPIDSPAQRSAIVDAMGLATAAVRNQ